MLTIKFVHRLAIIISKICLNRSFELRLNVFCKTARENNLIDTYIIVVYLLKQIAEVSRGKEESSWDASGILKRERREKEEKLHDLPD